jgi:hypothetical protein
VNSGGWQQQEEQLRTTQTGKQEKIRANHGTAKHGLYLRLKTLPTPVEALLQFAY